MEDSKVWGAIETMTEIQNQDFCSGCPYYGSLENVTTYHSKGETITAGAFICKNPKLIKKVDEERRIPFYVNGEKINDAILIGQVFMNCGREKS